MTARMAQAFKKLIPLKRYIRVLKISIEMLMGLMLKKRAAVRLPNPVIVKVIDWLAC
jgi:hypothetical protein